MSITEQNVKQWRPNRKLLKPCVDRTREAFRVCDMLEALADDLPQQTVLRWKEAQSKCRTVLVPHFALLHDVVLPKLLQENAENIDRKQLLLQLKSDCNDQVHALADLDDLISDALLIERLTYQPEALGYALRGHFEAIRRDLTWQLDVLWPLVARICANSEVEQILSFLEAKPPDGQMTH